jgi:hypothetical protein
MARSYPLLALALAFAGTIAPAHAQNLPAPLRGTPQEQRACAPDAVTLCKPYVEADDDAGVLKCFQDNRAKLKPACRAVLEKHGR